MMDNVSNYDDDFDLDNIDDICNSLSEHMGEENLSRQASIPEQYNITEQFMTKQLSQFVKPDAPSLEPPLVKINVAAFPNSIDEREVQEEKKEEVEAEAE